VKRWVILAALGAGAAAGQMGWTPAGMSGLQVWVKADAITGLNDGDSISTWSDQSGQGHDCTSSGSNRPVYKTGILNGLPVARFTGGSNQRCTHVFTGEPNTIFAAVKSPVDKHHRTIAGAQTNDAVAIEAYYFKTDEATTSKMVFSRPTTSDTTSDGDFRASTTNPDSTVNASMHNQWFVMSGRINGTTIELYRNRALVSSDTTASSKRPIATGGAVGAGYYNNALGDYCGCDIAELLIFDRALSDAEMEDVHLYLEGKWFVPSPHKTFLMTTFPQSTWPPPVTDEYLLLQQSDDGVTFTARPASYINDSPQKVRDPSAVYHNGTFWLAHTNTNGPANQSAFSVAKSEGSGLWRKVSDVDVSGSISGVTNVWAPEWFVDQDGSVHVLFGASTTGSSGNFTMYEIHPTNAAMTSWSAPAALSGLPTDAIDGVVWLDGSTYQMFVKNEATGQKYVERATATALAGPWTVVNSGDWAGWGQNREGPSMIWTGAKYRIYVEDYNAGQYKYSESASLASGWSAPADITGAYTQEKHGTIVRWPGRAAGALSLP
jgi:hypothetical protein